MATTERFLIAMALVYTLPWLVWRLGRTEHYAPLVVVQILTGIALGPGLLVAVYPGYYSFVFTPQVVQSLNGVAWWAVMVFVSAAALLVAAVVGKLAGTAVAGRLLDWKPGESWLIGWLLQTKALIMIIFSNVLLDRGIISSATFTALLLMTVGSTMLSIPVAAPALRRLETAGVLRR